MLKKQIFFLFFIFSLILPFISHSQSQKNEYQFGYGQVVDRTFGFTHHLFSQYNRKINHRIFLGVRAELINDELYAFRDVVTSSFPVNYSTINIHDNYASATKVEHDNINAGMISLGKDRHVTCTEFNIGAVFGVNFFKPEKKIQFKIHGGVGVNFTKDQGIQAGSIITPYDERIGTETGYIDIWAYKRGVGAFLGGGLQFVYKLGSRFGIGVESWIKTPISWTGSLFIYTKF